ncbi:MAG: hypothetical protein WDM84_00740 [Bauldia sp.]
MFKKLEKAIVARRHHRQGHPHRRPRPEDGAPDRGRGRRAGRAPTARRSSPAARPRRWRFATLGTGDDEQYVDACRGTYKETFLLHYNFPPYSVGETGRMGSPRPPRDRPRQARLAGDPPDAAAAPQFPYTLRVVSEITESNGSSSMATVCGTSLALMDAGRSPEAAGGGHRHGPHQGRRRPSSPCSRHPRRRGSPRATWTSRSPAARKASPRCRWTSRSRASPRRSCASPSIRPAAAACTSLGEMAKALPQARSQLGEFAPRIEVIQIPTDKIREVIGTGGQGHPRDRREDRRQGRHLRRRHGQGCRPPTARRSPPR